MMPGVINDESCFEVTNHTWISTIALLETVLHIIIFRRYQKNQHTMQPNSGYFDITIVESDGNNLVMFWICHLPKTCADINHQSANVETRCHTYKCITPFPLEIKFNGLD